MSDSEKSGFWFAMFISTLVAFAYQEYRCGEMEKDLDYLASREFNKEFRK